MWMNKEWFKTNWAKTSDFLSEGNHGTWMWGWVGHKFHGILRVGTEGGWSRVTDDWDKRERWCLASTEYGWFGLGLFMLCYLIMRCTFVSARWIVLCNAILLCGATGLCDKLSCDTLTWVACGRWWGHCAASVCALLKQAGGSKSRYGESLWRTKGTARRAYVWKCDSYAKIAR